jgi:ubiquinone/menaquinone biosynthesis C-methylase UbiE
MQLSQSDEVEKTLQKPDVHQAWEQAYRTPENEAFYELAFDAIANNLDAPKNSLILDVGCGSCAHSMRLVKHGFAVLAVDFSEPVLLAAEQNIKNRGMTDRVKLERQNILSLTYDDRAFDYILCWGVLMHIPEIEKAISELNRVLNNGGKLVITENNMNSFQAVLRRSLRWLRRTGQTEMIRTAAGLEFWTSTPSGKLLTRYADISWLKREFTRRGYTVKKNIPAQFSEFYLKMPGHAAKKLIHGFNAFWFKIIKKPRLAFGNILIVQKANP